MPSQISGLNFNPLLAFSVFLAMLWNWLAGNLILQVCLFLCSLYFNTIFYYFVSLSDNIATGRSTSMVQNGSHLKIFLPGGQLWPLSGSWNVARQAWLRLPVSSSVPAVSPLSPVQKSSLANTFASYQLLNERFPVYLCHLSTSSSPAW